MKCNQEGLIYSLAKNFYRFFELNITSAFCGTVAQLCKIYPKEAAVLGKALLYRFIKVSQNNICTSNFTALPWKLFGVSGYYLPMCDWLGWMSCVSPDFNSLTFKPAVSHGELHIFLHDSVTARATSLCRISSAVYWFFFDHKTSLAIGWDDNDYSS